jgi:UDP-N-acetyl-2-amino-2-deoxyglucuronate dehydrogenase
MFRCALAQSGVLSVPPANFPSLIQSMTSSKTLGFGIIGCGVIADFHAQAIANLTGARLVGVADQIEAAVTRLATKHQVGFATTNVAELLARPDIDIVCVTTPSGAHLEPALAAVKAGKHVVVEKPIEITVERVDELLKAADAANVKIAAIFQSRFGTGARTVKAAIEAGRFGSLVLCSAYVKWHRAADYYRGWKGTLKLDGGGAVMNQGVHAVDLLQWFAGMPEEVFAWKTRRVHTGIEAEDTAAATLRFASGALGSIEATTAAYPGFNKRIEITGSNGSCILEDDRILAWEFRDPKPEDAAIKAAGQTVDMGSGATNPTAINFYGHQLQLQDLVDAVRENRRPAVEGREARNAVALIRAIYASAESGKPVKVS